MPLTPLGLEPNYLRGWCPIGIRSDRATVLCLALSLSASQPATGLGSRSREGTDAPLVYKSNSGQPWDTIFFDRSPTRNPTKPMTHSSLRQRVSNSPCALLLILASLVSITLFPPQLHGEGLVFEFMAAGLSNESSPAPLIPEGACAVGEACSDSSLASLGPLDRIALQVSSEVELDFETLTWRLDSDGVRLILSGASLAQLPHLTAARTCDHPIQLAGASGTTLLHSVNCSAPVLDLGPGIVGFGPLVADEDGFESFDNISLYPIVLESVDNPLSTGWTTYGRLLLGWEDEYPWAEITRPLSAQGPPLSQFVEDASGERGERPLPAEAPCLKLFAARAAGYSTTPPLDGESNEILQLDFDDFTSE